MEKNFLEELDRSYIIPMQLMISTEGQPTDVRQTCYTVDDFQTIADEGLELRYDGLVTYETKTGKWKGCRKIDSDFVWEDLSGFASKDHTHPEYLTELSTTEPSYPTPKGHIWLEEELD